MSLGMAKTVFHYLQKENPNFLDLPFLPGIVTWKSKKARETPIKFHMLHCVKIRVCEHSEWQPQQEK